MRLALVVCPSYHGATLLALLLNNHTQVSALGDMLPRRDGEQVCACGRPSRTCDFWQHVAAAVDVPGYAGLPTLLPVLPRPLLGHQAESGVLRVSGSARLNHLAGRAAGTVADLAAPALWRARPGLVREFVAAHRRFYEVVLARHGTERFVDGTKSWRKAALLARELGDADVRIVHLVRDPRGFAASRRRHAGTPDVRESALAWAHLHERMARLQAAAPYRLLRYEDLCSRPGEEMGGLLGFLGLEAEDVVAPPRDPAKHHVLGNQMLRTFDGEVTLDERWRTELSAAEQRLVLAAAGATATRLGYTDDA